MGELYHKWMSQKDSLQILESYGLNSLDDSSQTLLEELTVIQHRILSSKANKLAGQIARTTGKSSGSIKRAADALNNLSYDVSAGGRDPLLDEDQHYKGGR